MWAKRIRSVPAEIVRVLVLVVILVMIGVSVFSNDLVSVRELYPYERKFRNHFLVKGVQGVLGT